MFSKKLKKRLAAVEKELSALRGEVEKLICASIGSDRSVIGCAELIDEWVNGGGNVDDKR